MEEDLIFDLELNEKEKPKVIRPKPLKKGKGEERRRQLTRKIIIKG